MFRKENVVLNTHTTFDYSKTAMNMNIKTQLGYQNPDYSLGMVMFLKKERKQMHWKESGNEIFGFVCRNEPST